MRVRIAVLFAVIIAGWLWLDARAQTPPGSGHTDSNGSPTASITRAHRAR